MNRLRFLAVLLALLTASCHSSYPTAPAPTIVALQVFYGSGMSSARLGWSYSFSAFAIRSDGAYQDVTGAATWSSSDSQVMRPRAAGSFTAVAVGQAEIVARYESMVAAVSIPVISNLATYPQLTISGPGPRAVGTKDQLYLSFRQSAMSSQEDVGDQATWTSANPLVATAEGRWVTAVRAGTTVIRATYNGLTAEFVMSVFPRS